MFLGVYNKSDSGTFSAGSWGSTLDNVKNRKLYSVARSTDATAANTKFQIDLGSSLAIKCLSLHAHNLSSAATITLKAGTTAGASDTLNSTGNNAYSVTFDATREFSTHYAVVIDADVTARYWTVEIIDTSNSDGYVEIGRVGLWQGLEPAINMSWGVVYGINDESETERSLGQDFLYNEKDKKRTANFALDFLTNDERDEAHELSRVSGRTGEILFHVSDQVYNMLGVLERPNALKRKFVNINSTEFEVIEL